MWGHKAYGSDDRSIQRDQENAQCNPNYQNTQRQRAGVNGLILFYIGLLGLLLVFAILTDNISILLRFVFPTPRPNTATSPTIPESSTSSFLSYLTSQAISRQVARFPNFGLACDAESSFPFMSLVLEGGTKGSEFM
jgi:hypothetical protein